MKEQPAPTIAATMPTADKREASESEEPHPTGPEGEQEQGRRRKRIDVDASLIISDGRSKRRRTPSPVPEPEVKVKKEEDPLDPKDPERAATLGKELYQKLMNTKDKEGEELAQPFLKLPSKRSFPDYYETIKHPMSLEMVQQKLNSKSYETLKDVIADFGQIFNNAKRYNTKESLLFQWAKRLHKITRTFYDNITSPGQAEADSDHEDVPAQADASMDIDERDDARGVSESGDAESAAAKKRRGNYMREGPTTYKLVKPVMKAIKDAESLDGTGRVISGIFEELPDRKDLPDYYKVITNPVSLNEIEGRMMARKYETWEEFFSELELMCANAFTYNEDDSEVYKDAQQIKNLLDYHRKDIISKLAQPQPSKFRVNPPASTPQRTSTSAEPTSAARHTPAPAPAPPAPAPNPGQYLPALPKGVVTEEVVASLDRYPLYEQQAWAQSLPPVSMQIYRQLQAANEARRRIAEGQGIGAQSQPAGAPAPPLPQLAELPSAGRPGGVSRRPPPPVPTIRCIDFAFSSIPTALEDRQAIRLHNMRGVVTHAIMVGSSTTDIELTAYITDPPKVTTNGEISPAQLENIPEVSVRINGNQGNLPRFIFSGDQQDRPAGMRWVVSVPSSRAETKIEIRATKPGALAETSSIYVNRQM